MDPARQTLFASPTPPKVELTTTIDVGDDKNTAPAKRAKIRATCNGPTDSSLAVTVTLHTGVHYKPGTGGATDLAATYGTTGTADYYLINGSGTWSTASPYTTGTLTIPAGAATGEISVVTRADNLTEQHLIVCRLATSTAYAPGVSTNSAACARREGGRPIAGQGAAGGHVRRSGVPGWRDGCFRRQLRSTAAAKRGDSC